MRATCHWQMAGKLRFLSKSYKERFMIKSTQISIRPGTLSIKTKTIIFRKMYQNQPRRIVEGATTSKSDQPKLTKNCSTGSQDLMMMEALEMNNNKTQHTLLLISSIKISLFLYHRNCHNSGLAKLWSPCREVIPKVATLRNTNHQTMIWIF